MNDAACTPEWKAPEVIAETKFRVTRIPCVGMETASGRRFELLGWLDNEGFTLSLDGTDYTHFSWGDWYNLQQAVEALHRI